MSAAVISIDAELGWGFHDLEEPPAARLEAARDGWRTLLSLLEEFDLPATWGIVGHLLLEDCQGVHDSHPLGPNWFARERGEWADRPDLRFGRDLVGDVLAAEQSHELAFQTFSHVELGHDAVGPELARAECAAFVDALETAAEDGLVEEPPTPVSALFPRNQVGHRDVLAEWGFEAYRGRPPGAEGARDAAAAVDDRRDGAARDGGVRDAVRSLARATVSAPPVVEPRVDEFGLVEVPTSLYLFDLDERTRQLCERVRTDPVVRAARRGVDRAASGEGVFHCWLHPNDLVEERDVERVRRVFSHLAERSGDDLDVLTLGELARDVRPTVAEDPPAVQP